MVRDEDLNITVPSYFRCPISLSVMKSPVSLCTGVTYDRSSIQRWLDGGNNTCPATMQVLKTKELVPNHTLHRLIKIWSESVTTQACNSPESLTREQAEEIMRNFEIDVKMQDISRIIAFSDESVENSKFLATIGAKVLKSLVSSIGKMRLVKDLCLFEKILVFCNVLLSNGTKIDAEEVMNCEFKGPIMIGLKQGRLELKIAVTKFLDLGLNLELHSSLIAEDDEIYSELLNLIIRSDYNPDAIESSLNLLTRLVLTKRNRAKLIRAGAVKNLTAALTEAELSPPLTEKVLKLLELASICKEGRDQICGSEIFVQAILKKVFKVSIAATETAVTVLWSLCCFSGDRRAAAAVADSHGVAKILLLLQSNCSPGVRQMCGDLLKVLRCDSKMSSLSCYDTKTTHIMPF